MEKEVKVEEKEGYRHDPYEYYTDNDDGQYFCE